MRNNKQPLTTSDLQLQFILDASPVGMLVFNDREEIIAANPPAERLFGHSPHLAPPSRCGDFIRCANRLQTSGGCGHSDSCPSCLLFHSLRATLAGTATNADREGETRLVREPGCEPLWIRYKISPLALNGLRGALLTVDDMTTLRRSEQRYAQLFREMLNAFALHEILCDELGNPVDYRFLAVNPAFERMTGLHAAQVIGRTILNVLPGTEPHWITTYGQVALTGQPVFFENYSREIGKHFSVHAFSPAPGQFACLFEDITERKQAERSAQESREFLQTVLNSIPVRVFWKDKNLRYLGCNTAFANDAGFEQPEEIIGKDDYAMGWREQAELYQADDRDVIERRSVKILFEEEQTTPTGGRIHLLTSKLPLRDADGAIMGVLGVYNDITLRKQAEMKIRLNEARLRKLVDILQHPAENASDFLNYALEQAIQLTGSAIGYLYHYHEERQELVLNAWSKEVLPACAVASPQTSYQLHKTGLWGEAIRQRRPMVVNDFQAPHPLKRGVPEGHVQLLNFMTVPIVRNERIVGVVGLANKETDYEETDVLQISLLMESIWNVTERKLIEEERKRLQAQLAQAQKLEAIGTLAGGIAHDFNNVLGAVLGYAEMARDSSPHGSTVAKDLDKVIEAGRRAASLVKRILAFSRQSASERVPLDPSLIVKEVCRLLRPSLPSTIDIRQHTAATRSVLADPAQMHQILMNLCTNAFHAMERTGGVLEITLGECELTPADLNQQPGIEPGGFIVLSVADTGPGISPAIRERIFDPYFTTKGVGKGTGMGLAIVHGIAAEYGGFLTCESEPGEGATFKVFLPAIDGETVPVLNEEETVPIGRGHILLVDDEEVLAEMGKTMLERLQYQVTACTSSLEGLTVFQNEPDRFDAVITDQTMPGMTGVELARRMLLIRPSLPIILCTGYSNLVNEAQAKACGIKGFVMKPLTKKEIGALLHEVLDAHK
jgi:PAS domain S-box-containing protein